MERVINADQLAMALVTRRLPGIKARWCAMSAHTITQACRRGTDPIRSRMHSHAGPMTRGNLHRVLDRIAACGAKTVRHEFGVGIRALRAENAYVIER